MIKKALLFVSACVVVVLSVAAYQAQENTPPKPQTPAKPQTAPRVMVSPDRVEGADFAFLLNERSFLGVETEDIKRDNMSRYGLSEPRGVGIRNVLKDSPAERAGLKTNDVILKFDGERVGSARKLQRLVGETAPEHGVKLTISRGGSEQEVAVTIGENRFTMPHVATMQFPGGDGWRGEFEKMQPFEKMLPGAQSFTMAFGSSRRIGATISTLTKQLGDYFGVTQGGGLLVSSVTADSPAAKAGLRAGDVITEVEGERIEKVGDFFRAMNKKKEGDVALTVIRDKRPLSLRVTPEQRQGDFDFDFPPDAMIAPTAPETPLMTLPRINSAPRVRPAPRTLPLIVRGGNITI